MADINGNEVSWKKLWQLISGIHYETPNHIVLTKLQEVSRELKNGVLSQPTAKTVAKEILDKPSLQHFSEHVQQYLGITAIQASNLICSYLQYEYKGSGTSLINCLATDQQKHLLLIDIAKYYSLERIVLLKVVRNMLELYTSKVHPYADEYNTVLQDIQVATLRKSYIDQLAAVIKSTPPPHHPASDYYKSANKIVNWSEHCARETIEILQIILLTIEADGIRPAELSHLVELFRSHSFGKQQTHLNSSNSIHVDLVARITYSEVAIYLKSVDCSSKSLTSPDFVSETVRLLDKLVVGLHQNAEHGPILLAWMLFNMQSITVGIDDDEATLRYRQFGTRATHLGVFEYLHGMISHVMYKDLSCVARIVRRTVYNHLTQLCDLFDADGSVAQHAKIFELLSELLRTSGIAKDFCSRDDTGVRSLYNTALENFPIDFSSLSMIAEAVASTGAAHQSYIRKQLENLPIYAEHFKPESNIPLKQLPHSNAEFVLLANYAPFDKIDFVIAAGTSVFIQDTATFATIHFRTPLNYFNVLHNEINELLAESQRYTEIGEERNRRVCLGLKYLALAVRAVRDPQNEITNEMVHPTEMVFDVLSKFKMMQSPPIALLAKCLDVSGSLLPLFEDEIFQRVINLNILPFVANEQLDYKSYCAGVSFESGLVGYYLINFEKNIGRYDFLLTYLEFLKTYTKLSRTNTSAIELPGLVFMLREIFPHVHAWRFESESDRQKIYISVMQYFLEVLQVSSDNVHRLLLRNVCVYSLLNMDNGMTLLRFVAIGNDQLQSIMQNVSNWMTAAETGFNLLVQLAMTILMQILRLRKPDDVDHKHGLSPLESIIYTQPKQRDNLRIIPVVTSYMSNIFNRRLPLLSCRLLRRFAIEFQMSLLACLDMEPDQIRLTFLQRLPDDQESDQLKIAVIEFVEACIDKQPGLTEAFFKIKNERRYLEKTPKTKDIGDGILTYMTQYLETISSDPNRIVSPLLSKIMSIFHALWKNNMQSLVQDLTATDSFWPSLFNPLYGPIKQDIQAYSQLFNILGIELFRGPTVSGNLRKSFNQFFAFNNFQKWVTHIFDLPKETASQQIRDETPEWLCRLQSFKTLIVMLITNSVNHGIGIDEQCRIFISDQCLLALVDRSEYVEDSRPFIILSEMYLIIMLHFESRHWRAIAEETVMLSQITAVLHNTAITYREIHCRARESVLAIALNSIGIMPDQFGRHPAVARSFLRSTVSILCCELADAECQIAQNTVTTDGHMSTVLSLSLMKRIAMNFSAQSLSSSWSTEIISHKIVNRLLSCLQAALHLHAFRKIVVEMLDVLIVLAQDICAAELLHCDIGNYLWLKLLPPKELLQVIGPPASTAIERGHVAAVATVSPRWKANEWWPVYARGMQLVTALMQAHGYLFLREALMFVGVHEEYVIDSIMLAKVDMDAEATMLIKTSLLFVAEMVQYEKQWRLEHPQSLINLMRCVQTMLDHAVSLLYRPRILKQLMDGNAAPQIELVYQDVLTPTDELIATMNDLIAVVTICAKCLLVFSPKLLDLLVESQFVPSQWQPLVEIQFGAPKLNVIGAVPQLTFGTILMAVAIFTKSLSLQIFTFHNVPLNRMQPDAPNDTIDGNDTMICLSEPSVSRTLSSPASANRNLFTKSLSMTSSTSNVTTAPSNEILSILDERLCTAGLEFVLTLLGTQSLLALKNPNMSTREKQLIKRELGTELVVYHDFVRRRLQHESKGLLYRRKRGVAMLRSQTVDQNDDVDDDNDDNNDDDSADVTKRPQSQPGRTSLASRQSQSIRVNVIRKQHVQSTSQSQTKTPSPQSLKRPPIDISPISGGLSTPPKGSKFPTSTPIESGSRVILNPHSKRVTFSEDAGKRKMASRTENSSDYQPNDMETTCLGNDKSGSCGHHVYTGLSTVQLYESDYLHFMSNLFAFICQND